MSDRYGSEPCRSLQIRQEANLSDACGIIDSFIHTRQHPPEVMQNKDIPNAISLLRMLLVPPFILALLAGQYPMALTLFAVAGISDALDGYLAKHYGWISRLGSILDPLADKLLLVSAYVALAWLGQIPAWLVAVVIARDLIIVIGGVFYHYKIAPIRLMAPTVLSKLNTFAQLSLVLVILISRSFLPLPNELIILLIYLVLITTLLSGLSYIWSWGVRGLHEIRRQPHD